MAFATSAANAEKGAKWNYIDAKGVLQEFTSGLTPEVQLKEIENEKATLHFKTAGGTEVDISCKKGTLVGAKLVPEGALSKGKVKFTGCFTELNKKASPPCEPKTGATKGEVITLDGLGLIILHNGTPLLLIKPETGTALAHIELGEECSIGTEVLVIGELVLKDCNGLFTKEEVEHLVIEGPLTSLTALGQPATIVGSAWAKLVGAHEGLKWAGLPI
jgi:hypothetical protein